ncbi:MAG: secretin N-terminal domain-containing protein [Nitrospirales bacterium]
MITHFFRLLLLLLVASLVACTLQEFKLGEELEQKGDWDGAVNAYREALRKDPFNKDIEKKYQAVKTKSAEQHFSQGRKWLKEGKLAEALQEFQVALGLDPQKAEHHTALNDAWRLKNARQTLLDAKQMENLGRFDDALNLYETAVELDPSLIEAVEGITRVVQQQKAIQTIGGSAEPVTLRFQNTRLKQVFEILARTANIDILFDKDVRDDLVTIFTKDTPFEEALNLILTTNQLFAKRVGPDRLLIVPDTKQKREQYEDLQIRTFYLSNSKAKDMANLLRTILETKRVYVNEPINTVVIRDEPDKIALAEQIILANDRQDSEVVFELEVLEVNKTKTQRIGLNFAKQAGFGVFPNGTTSFSTIPQTFTYQNLTSLGQSSYLFTFPSSVLLDFFKQESDAKTLANPKIRVLNNQKASINIGDKQPILLSTTNVLPGQAATGAVPTTSTVTSIEFKDTGIKLTVEPVIHLNNSITLRLQVEVTRLGDRVILQADPEISQFRFGTRTADTALNMRDGETVVLAGLIQEEDRKGRESVPGIDDIPGLGNLLSNQNTEKVTNEVILVITPHIVRNVQPPQLAKHTLWSGTANQYSSKPLFSVNNSNLAAVNGESSGTLSSPPEDPSTLPPTEPSADAPPQEQEPVGSEQPEDPPTQNPGLSRIQVIPAAGSFKIGETIQLSLQGLSFNNVERTSLALTFDPAVLTFKQATEGSFWISQQVPPSLTVSAIPNAGRIMLQMGQPGKAVQGGGVLATLTFEATGAGTSEVHVQNPAVLGPNALVVPVVVQHGTIWVE